MKNTATRGYDKHWRGVLATLTRQNDLSRYARVISPYLAIRNLPVAATGFYTNLDFRGQAENYRRYFLRTMNTAVATHSKLGAFYGYKAGKHSWTSVKDCAYTISPLNEVLPRLSGFSKWLIQAFLLHLLSGFWVHYTCGHTAVLCRP